MKNFLVFMQYLFGIGLMVVGASIVMADPLTDMWSDLFMRLGGLVVGVLGVSVMSEALETAF